MRRYLFAAVSLLALAGPARAADIVFEPMLEAQGVIPGTASPKHMRDNTQAGAGELPGPGFWKTRMGDLEP